MIDEAELEAFAQGLIAREDGGKTRKRVTTKVGIALFLVLAIVGIVAGATLFIHTFPATPPSTAPTLTSTCTTLVQNGPTSIVSGTAGAVLYTCGSPPSPTTNALTAIAGSATPTFTLPSAGVTSLSYVTHSSTSTTCSPGTALSSGSPAAFTAGTYDYCLAYSSYPIGGISSFTITWSQ